MIRQNRFEFDSLREEVIATSGIIPRDYQQQAIDEAFRQWHSGITGVLVRSPTGSGKTITGTMIGERWLAQGRDCRVMVIAHERQLVHQFADEIKDVTGKSPGIEMAAEKVRANAVPRWTVASRQTLIADTDEGGDFKRFHKFDNKRYRWLVICDEVHRWAYKLKSCRPVLEWFDLGSENRRLGLTATPMRGDGTSLAKVCPGVASDYKLWDLDGPSAVADGWAVPYDQRFVVAEGVDFKNLRELKSTGDFDPAELEQVLGEEKMLRALCEPTLKIVGDRRTIIFSATTEMAKAVARCLNGYRPDSAVELDGSHNEWHRRDVYQRHQNGSFQFLSVVGLCREGYNDPGIRAVAIFRPTKSRTLAEQMKGRGCRPLRGLVRSDMTREARLEAIAASSKPACIIVDLVGVSGMADCASTAHVLASGQPDEVIERANRNAMNKKGPVDIGEEIKRARREIDQEEKERRRIEREAREQRERDEAARRGKIQSKVSYHETRVEQGHGSRQYRKAGPRKGPVMWFGKYKGVPMAEVPAGYRKWMLYKSNITLKPEYRQMMERSLEPRAANPMPAVNAIEDINALLQTF